MKILPRNNILRVGSHYKYMYGLGYTAKILSFYVNDENKMCIKNNLGWDYLETVENFIKKGKIKIVR